MELGLQGLYILACAVDWTDGLQQGMDSCVHYVSRQECKEGLDFRSWKVPHISQPFVNSGPILLKSLRASHRPAKPRLQASFVLMEQSIQTDSRGFYK